MVIVPCQLAEGVIDWIEEQDRAEELLSRLQLAGTGGSDAHLASAIGKCMTHFDAAVSSEAELVAGLRNGGFHPVLLDETLKREP